MAQAEVDIVFQEKEEEEDKEMEEISFHLSNRTKVSYNGTLIHFTVYPLEEGSEGIDPTVISYTTTLWKKIKYQMSRATAQLKERKKGKIKLLHNKYLDIKQGANDIWQVNIMAYARSGAVITPSSVFLKEDEWEALVNCEPKITEKVEEFLSKRYPAAKKSKTNDSVQAMSSKKGILFSWSYQGYSCKETFFSKEHAMENCRTHFPEASNNDIVIKRETVDPPELTAFLKFAHCYGKRAVADYLDHYGNEDQQNFDTLLAKVELPKNWLVTAFTQFYLHMGISLAPSKAEPYIQCLLAFLSEEEINHQVKNLDMDEKSPFHLLCRDIVSPFLPCIAVD